MVKSQLSQAGILAIFVAASEEFAKSIVLTVLGPVRNAFLKLVDPTQTELDTILREPLETGSALARQALSILIGGANDERLRDQHLYALVQTQKRHSPALAARRNQKSALRDVLPRPLSPKR